MSWTRFLVLALPFTVACSLLGPRDPRPRAPDRSAVLDAKIETLGRRTHPNAPVLQLEDTWLQLDFVARGMGRLRDEQRVRLCAYNLRAAKLLAARYADKELQKLAHAVESSWRFRHSAFAPCRRDATLGKTFAEYLDAAAKVYDAGVTFVDRDWAAASDDKSLLLVQGRFYGTTKAPEQAAIFNGEQKVGEERTFDGFDVRETFGRYKVEAKYKTRAVIETRDDRWAVVAPGGSHDAAALRPMLARARLVLLVPTGTRAVSPKNLPALAGNAVATAVTTTSWNWVSWSTRRLPTDEGLALLHRAPSVREVARGEEPAEVTSQPVAAVPPPSQTSASTEPRSAAPPERTSEPVVRSPSPLAWVGFGTGAAGFLLGGIAGGIAMSQANQLKRACGGTSCQGAITEAELNRATAIAHASTAGFVIGGVGAAVGIVGLFIGVRTTGESKRAATSIILDVDGIALRGSF